MKKVLVAIGISVVFIFAFYTLLSPNLSGFAIFSGPEILCDDSPPTISGLDNSMSVNYECGVDQFGPNLNTDNTKFYCENNNLTGSGSFINGLTISATGASLYSCNVQGFTTAISVGAGKDVTLYWNVTVNVTDSSGNAISGAQVNLTGINGAGYLGDSAVSGLYNVLVKNRTITNPGSMTTTDFGPYNINVTKSGYVENSSMTYSSAQDQFISVILGDASPPEVTISSPSGSYSVRNVEVNISINEAGGCNYTIDNWATNNTMTSNSTNTGFNASLSGLANAVYTIKAYCWDSAGNINSTESGTFTISVSSGDTGGGGGGGCSDVSWTYSNWSVCSGASQTRTKTSNCGSTSIETQSCTVCNNQCTVVGSTCSGNLANTCTVNELGCYVLTSVLCNENQTCSSGTCVAIVRNETETIVPPIVKVQDNKGLDEGVKPSSDTAGSWRPSDIIPHGDIPAVIVDTAAGTVGIAAVAGFSWTIWLWLAAAFLPMFAIKLRHYSVSVFDSGNRLGMFEKGKLNTAKLVALLSALETRYGKLVFAERNQDTIKYLVSSGFIEIRTDDLFIVTGHFSKAEHAKEFENALRQALFAIKGGNKVPVMKQVERASIIRAWRDFMRERRSRHELHKLIN